MSDVILVKVSPLDREWVARALRSVLGPDDIEHQRALLRLVAEGFRGYTAPMTAGQADELADLVFAARDKGGDNWERSMTRVSEQFRTQRVKAVQAKTSRRWVPENRSLNAVPPRKRYCPECSNPAEPVSVGKATDWICVNCDSAVLPEGEA